MLFKDIIGHQELKQRLIQTVKNGRISHAQLFLGKEGNGALPLAIAYFQYIACTQRQDDDSCGTCASCLKFAKLIHPDLHFVFPVNTTEKIKKDPVSDNFLQEWRQALLNNAYMSLFDWLEGIGIDNKQGNISVVESGFILRKLSLKPYESEYRLMLIWMPEKMSNSAANKLLKILEEPPAKTIFILVAEQYDQLLPTIRSRTQLVKVNKINDEEMRTYLMFEYQLSIEQAYEVVNLADGNFNEAIKLASETESEHYFMKLFREWMLLCFDKKFIELVDMIDVLESLKREKQKKFLIFCLHIIRESLVMAYSGDALVKAYGKEKEFLSKFHKRLIGADTMDIIEEFDRSIYHIERNANAKILFMDLSLKLFRWFSRQNQALAKV